MVHKAEGKNYDHPFIAKNPIGMPPFYPPFPNFVGDIKAYNKFLEFPPSQRRSVSGLEPRSVYIVCTPTTGLATPTCFMAS